MCFNNLHSVDSNWYIILLNHDRLYITNCTCIGLPVINITPSIQTVEVTFTVQFIARVTGVGPFTYQWEREDKVLTAETGNTYVVNNASQEDQNYYRCIVTNKFGGSVVSNRLWLQVTSMLTLIIAVYMHIASKKALQRKNCCTFYTT